MDMIQMGFNVAITLVGFLGGWVLRSITQRIDELQQSEHSLRNKLQAVELLVAGQYVRKEDLEKFGDAIFKKLDKLEERLMANRP